MTETLRPLGVAALQRLRQHLGVVDVFRQMHPRKREFDATKAKTSSRDRGSTAA